MPTVGNTHPGFMDEVEALSREHGLTVHSIAQGRAALGVEGDLLDAYTRLPEVTFTPEGGGEPTRVEIQ